MKKLITEKDILDLVKSGRNFIQIGENDLITPLAMDAIKSFSINISLLKVNKIDLVKEASLWKTLAIGSDHTGFFVKSVLCDFLIQNGYIVNDYGTFNEKSCDYPDYAAEVAKNVALKNVDFGILVDATGIPSAITANKFPGIRAATCYNEFSAKSARSHNNSNILVVGAKTLGEESIKAIVDIFCKTQFEGGRHQNRINKITEIENQFLKYKG